MTSWNIFGFTFRRFLQTGRMNIFAKITPFFVHVTSLFSSCLTFDSTFANFLFSLLQRQQKIYSAREKEERARKFVSARKFKGTQPADDTVVDVEFSIWRQWESMQAYSITANGWSLQGILTFFFVNWDTIFYSTMLSRSQLPCKNDQDGIVQKHHQDCSALHYIRLHRPHDQHHHMIMATVSTSAVTVFLFCFFMARLVAAHFSLSQSKWSRPLYNAAAGESALVDPLLFSLNEWQNRKRGQCWRMIPFGNWLVWTVKRDTVRVACKQTRFHMRDEDRN